LATFTVVSDTYITAKVPVNGMTGSVTVTTPTGTLTSNTKFKVIPTLTSFSPTTGTVGTPVVLIGTALSQTSKVTFGGVKATSLAVNSATKVTAIVPVGAKTGNIVVTTPGGTASKGTFTVY
jgi:IPT/TIG domain-containing protein